VLAAAGETAAAETVVQRLQEATGNNPTQRNQLESNRVFAALYKPRPEGFEEAIAIGEPLLNTEQKSNGQLMLWLACAYGQKASHRRNNVPFPPNDPSWRDDPDALKALDRLTEVKNLRPDLVTLARSLMYPQPGSPENDLAIFANISEFRTLLGDPRA
jgi:hypothetical protein